MQHITEIVPELDTMPDWAQKAFKEGNFFNVALKMVEELEAKVQGLDVTGSQWSKRAQTAEAQLEETKTWLEIRDKQLQEALNGEDDG